MAVRSFPLARQREQLAWELHAEGVTEKKIADEIEAAGLGEVTQQGVSRMLQRVEKRVLKDIFKRVEGMKLRQTASLMNIYQQAMQAWEKSKGPQRSIIKRMNSRGTIKEGEPAGGIEQVTTEIKEQTGDPRYLEQARAGLADIRKIWGIDAPTKLSGPNGKAIPVEIVEFDTMRPDDGESGDAATNVLDAQ